MEKQAFLFSAEDRNSSPAYGDILEVKDSHKPGPVSHYFLQHEEPELNDISHVFPVFQHDTLLNCMSELQLNNNIYQ